MNFNRIHIWYAEGPSGGVFSNDEGWWWQGLDDVRHGPYTYRSVARKYAEEQASEHLASGASQQVCIEYTPPIAAKVTDDKVESSEPLDSDLSTMYDKLSEKIKTISETESRVSSALYGVQQELAAIKSELPEDSE